MARRATRGTSILGNEIEKRIHVILRRYARSRKETIREVLERAILREVENPPPAVRVPALPDYATA